MFGFASCASMFCPHVWLLQIGISLYLIGREALVSISSSSLSFISGVEKENAVNVVSLSLGVLRWDSDCVFWKVSILLSVFFWKTSVGLTRRRKDALRSAIFTLGVCVRVCMIRACFGRILTPCSWFRLTFKRGDNVESLLWSSHNGLKAWRDGNVFESTKFQLSANLFKLTNQLLELTTKRRFRVCLLLSCGR